MEAARYEVIFDGDCGICQRSRRWAGGLDASAPLEWIPLQDPEVYRRHPSLRPEDCDREIHVIAPDGTLFRGYEAMRVIASQIRKLSWLAGPMHWAPVTWVGRHLYRYVASHRKSSLGCELPAAGHEASRKT